ncbi:MAG: 50S ribosomal protein L6 [Dehalococcoidia bacterium]
MSRIGRMPIPIPAQVQVNIDDDLVMVKGPKGELQRRIAGDMRLHLDDGRLLVTRLSDQPRHRALHGLTRTLLANMVTGVVQGFAKVLEMQGTGYRAQKQGDKVVLQVGYSHPVEVEPPPGITFEVEGTNRVLVQGIDKELVGQVAANIRAIRPPEPYKGKGIRYAGEYVRRNAGKAGRR